MTTQHITPQEARNLLDQQAAYTYIDVRSVAEFEAGRPPGAYNIPLAEPNPMTGQMELNEHFLRVVQAHFSLEARLIVGCMSGGRSAVAQRLLLDAGFACVLNMEGGFGGMRGPGTVVLRPGWQTLGFDIEDGEAGDRSYQKLADHR